MKDLVLKTLRSMRIEKNYTQEDISIELNISQSYYGRIENGKADLNISNLYKILIILDTDYIDFFLQVKAKEEK
ncbi:helix-turn-helix transcriptional regulator [Flavobacterium sp.]|jgi:transcriptional regulator with XRE-family HTH domain|uniref:helix-turn-helix transcriptional regulator n=1 Tax=Flavobacterium sp. TaxID=239 RepID=UPI0037BE8CC6